ncbi:MAG: hypothetical protein ACRDMX_10840 [Solirubrobacteraceae bacterium]
MAADNLIIVSGRIAFLDIYALAPMVWGVALYLRGRVVAASALLAVAECMKVVSVYTLLVLGLLELFRVLLRARDHRLAGRWAWRPAHRATGDRRAGQRGAVHRRAMGFIGLLPPQ